MRHFAILAALLLSAPALAVSPQDFAYGVRLDTSVKSPAYRVELPIDVYRGVVSAELADLRVFNSKNEAVPYELRRPKAASAPGPASRLPMFPLQGDPRKALDALRITVQSGAASLDLKTGGEGATETTVGTYILDARKLGSPIAALEVEWPEGSADFAGRLDVEASDDLAAWRSVAHAVPIANLHADNQRLVERRAEFGATKAKFWRLTWDGDAPPFALSGVNAERARNVVEAKHSSLTIEGSPVESKPGEFAFDLAASFPVDRVNIELPQRNSVATISIWSRTDTQEIWRSVARQGFYRLDGDSGELRNADLHTDIDSDRYWLLRFEMPDDMGDGVPKLNIAWIPHELLFVARGDGPYVLAYGNATLQSAETRLASVLPKLEIASARASAPFDLGGPGRRDREPQPFPWKRAVLWAVLAVGVALLGWMALRLSRQLGPSEKARE